MSKALILTGTNTPPCPENLQKASTLIISKGISVISASSIYKSPPWGFESKNEFLNQVLMVETTHDPFKLMQILLEIEKEMGRNRKTGPGYEDRIIDLDILLYNKEVIVSDVLILPHPRMELRRFALMPSAEIAGDWIHPILRISIHEMLKNCEDTSQVLLAE